VDVKIQTDGALLFYYDRDTKEGENARVVAWEGVYVCVCVAGSGGGVGGLVMMMLL
jgi:hypothetical protein